MAALKELGQVKWCCLRRSQSLYCAPWARQTWRYGLAVILTAAAFLLRLHLERTFHNSDAFIMFLLAAIAVNWICGLGPCLLTLLLGSLAGAWFFAPPHGRLLVQGANQWFDFLTFLVAGLVVAWYGWARRRSEEDLAAEVQQRHRAQEALHQAQSQLEHRVQERTVDLQHSLQGMREFTYSIAHNLFAPLRAAHGFAEMLLAHSGPRLDQQGREFAGHILEAAARMGNLLEALLDYGRVASVEAPLGKLATQDLVQVVVKEVQACPAGNWATIDIEPPLPPVQANPELFAQALRCLLHNAVKFVPPGVKPQVRIRAEPRNGLVRLHVRDNGIGIDPRFHQDIFGAFNRLVPDGSPSTGMGLTIAQKAVERMHGTIGLESHPGQGSSFWMELPRAD